MDLTRRTALKLAAGTGMAALLPLPVWAEDNGTQAAIDEFTGGAATAETGITLTAPEIAENGNTVPVEFDAPGAVAVVIFAPGNPNPGIAQFNFSKLATPAGSTRIRLAGTQDLIAVAKMSDGSFAKTTRNVKVTIGGCGG